MFSWHVYWLIPSLHCKFHERKDIICFVCYVPYLFFLFICLVTKLCWTFATPRIIANEAPLSMGFFRQEYWRGLPSSSPGDLPNPGIKPSSPSLWADSLPLSHQGSPRTGYSRQMPILAYMVMKESCLKCFFRKGPHSIWWESTCGLKLFPP